MTDSVAGVIKKDRIRTSPPRPAGAAGGAFPPAEGPETADDLPEVRIAEQFADGAVLEVRCPCGRVTYGQCQWEVPAAGHAAAAQGGPGPKEVQ
ncbi:MAG: hypothetical protein IMZ55_14000 [Acidobacteria bacterium]|nr:hypothetical protein [Acidobacteriota bacterium]